MPINDILIRPIITEKSMQETAANRYTFEVARNARKGQIKQAIKEVFAVEVIKVRTVKLSGKRRRVGRARREIKRPDGKKAIVELKEGQKIDLFETQN